MARDALYGTGSTTGAGFDPARGQKSVLADLPRGDPGRPAESYKPPEAAFAAPAALVADDSLRRAPDRLFFGVLDGQVRRDDVGRRHVVGGEAVWIGDDRHVITVAGSRAGKGRAVVVPNLLHYKGSVIATDPKGELARITARQRAQGLRQTVFVLDPFGEVKGPAGGLRRGFNPIVAMRKGSLVEDAALIADALVVSSPDRDPHWDESARTFIEGLVLHVATSENYEDRRSLVTVRQLAGRGVWDPDAKKPTMKALRFKMENNRHKEAGDVIRSAAADFFERPDREQGSVLSTVRRNLKFIDLFLGRPEGRRTLENHDFDLDILKAPGEGATIYLCLPARHMGTCARWLRLFVNLALQAMERGGVPRAGALPVLFVLDEFASLGHMRQIEDAAGQIAGYGVKLWPILQDLGQLQYLYKGRWETFMGNAGVLQFFGNNDLTTLEWISRRCDRTIIKVRKDSPTTFDQTSDTAAGKGGWESEAHDLLTPGEVARYFGRDDPFMRQIIIRAGHENPLLVMQRAFYDKHAIFRNDAGHPLFDK